MVVQEETKGRENGRGKRDVEWCTLGHETLRYVTDPRSVITVITESRRSYINGITLQKSRCSRGFLHTTQEDPINFYPSNFTRNSREFREDVESVQFFFSERLLPPSSGPFTLRVSTCRGKRVHNNSLTINRNILELWRLPGVIPKDIDDIELYMDMRLGPHLEVSPHQKCTSIGHEEVCCGYLCTSVSVDNPKTPR